MTILPVCFCTMMDKQAFLDACSSVLQSDRARSSIGTLGEKSVHAALKRYIDPDESHHEISVGKYVADVCNEAGFFEIQTRGFYRLKEKLDVFLSIDKVTLIHPVSAKKWILWTDENGCTEPRRLAPRRLTTAAVLPELYSLRTLLSNPRLRICVLLLEEEEIRLKNGTGPNAKKRAAKFDRYPIDLIDELWLECPEDYLALIPNELPDDFSAKDFAKAAHIPAKKASTAMNVLFEIGAVRRVGRRKNAYLYQRALSGR